MKDFIKFKLRVLKHRINTLQLRLHTLHLKYILRVGSYDVD